MTIIAACQVAAMALWFSASAVIPSLAAEFHLSNFEQATLTTAVQVGFVVGCLVSAVFGFADRLELRHLFAASAIVAQERPKAGTEVIHAVGEPRCSRGYTGA